MTVDVKRQLLLAEGQAEPPGYLSKSYGEASEHGKIAHVGIRVKTKAGINEITGCYERLFA